MVSNNVCDPLSGFALLRIFFRCFIMDEFKDSLLIAAIEQCEENIQSAQLLLETKDTLNATRHIRACKKIIKEMKDIDKRKELEIKCRACHARIHEAKGKYLAASFNYYEISKYEIPLISDSIAHKERSNALDNAIKCIILAKPCSARDDLLQKIYKDKRSEISLSFKMIRCLYENRIISQTDQDEFGQTLPLKDQVTLIGEYTILQKAIYEHNMRAIARLYKNIRIKDLSLLLGLSMDASEDLARSMIGENRLHGVIDQIDKEITFDDERPLYSWNIQIKETLLGLHKATELIQERKNAKVLS